VATLIVEKRKIPCTSHQRAIPLRAKRRVTFNQPLHFKHLLKPSQPPVPSSPFHTQAKITLGQELQFHPGTAEKALAMFGCQCENYTIIFLIRTITTNQQLQVAEKQRAKNLNRKTTRSLAGAYLTL
jgi:hypothetical protein